MGSELILYQTEDGLAQVQLRALDGGVWLSQLEIAELFLTTKQNVSLHVRNVLKEGELAEDSVVKESLTTAADGKRCRTKLHRLEMILAVGYRVKLLARIREIRASEKRFYQKVRDLFALSADYRADDGAAHLFFAEVQNKLLYAVVHKTAAELVVARADPASPHMALTTGSGSRVRKHDVIVAKNYLS